MSVRNLVSGRRRLLAALPAAALVTGTLLAVPAEAGTAHEPGTRGLAPGNLLVSGSTYTNDPGIVAGQTVLPPGCSTGCVTATANGTYPQVFSNVLADPNFGVTASITLTELVTSFSSKSELALNLSTSGRYVTFMGYDAAPDTVDVSNSNTPGVVDPTNPVPGAYYRVVARLGADGRFQFTNTNTYSGNNGRAAIRSDRARVYYTAGNAGNGVNTVYFLETTGKACPSGTGLPSNMCVLNGFPTALKSTTSFPFGLWFANPHTLYVADEGNGDNTYSAATGTYTTAAGQTTAGLQK